MKDDIKVEDLYVIRNNQKKALRKLKWVFTIIMIMMMILFVISLNFIVNAATEEDIKRKNIEGQIKINNKGNDNFCSSVWDWHYCPYFLTLHLEDENIYKFELKKSNLF